MARNVFCSVYNFPNLGCAADQKVLRQGTSAFFRLCTAWLQNKRTRLIRGGSRDIEEVPCGERRHTDQRVLEGCL
jgi:hypothetical protein